jgi:serine kinase of HPr protein (carbohydrate metabolism regulator)
VIVHATAIARYAGAGRWTGALLFGAPGSGKSDLALRALETGWRLVSDDYSLVWASAGRLWARAPETIRGRMEARGVGIVREPALELVCVALAVKCETGSVERLPDPEVVHVADLAVPCVRLHALEASALPKLGRALTTRALGADEASAYLAASRDVPGLETG